jgi:hypothetical protein
MDAKLKTILKNLPTKKLRSRLEPYRELIREMRRRGRSYREIIHVLHKQCGVKVSISTLHDFVRLRSRSRTIALVSSGVSQNAKTRKIPTEHSKDMECTQGEQRNSKERKSYTRTNSASQNKPVKRTLFQYNPDEPLRLPGKHREGESQL